MELKLDDKMNSIIKVSKLCLNFALPHVQSLKFPLSEGCNISYKLPYFIKRNVLINSVCTETVILMLPFTTLRKKIIPFFLL